MGVIYFYIYIYMLLCFFLCWGGRTRRLDPNLFGQCFLIYHNEKNQRVLEDTGGEMAGIAWLVKKLARGKFKISRE